MDTRPSDAGPSVLWALFIFPAMLQSFTNRFISSLNSEDCTQVRISCISGDKVSKAIEIHLMTMGFPRQESWVGLPFLSPGDLPGPGTEPESPELARALFTTEPAGKPNVSLWWYKAEQLEVQSPGYRFQTCDLSNDDKIHACLVLTMDQRLS